MFLNLVHLVLWISSYTVFHLCFVGSKFSHSLGRGGWLNETLIQCTNCLIFTKTYPLGWGRILTQWYIDSLYCTLFGFLIRWSDETLIQCTVFSFLILSVVKKRFPYYKLQFITWQVWHVTNLKIEIWTTYDNIP